MPSHFSRALRTIDADTPARNLATFALIVAFLAMWGGWFALGRVAIYASSSSARLEVDRESHPVDALVGGRIVVVRVAAGQMVRAGDVILELDASSERLARAEEAVLLAPALSQLKLLEEELGSQQRALDGERRAAQEGMAQSESESTRALATADFAADEARRLAELHARKLVSEIDTLRAANLAAERRNQANSAGFAARRLARDFEAREQDRLGQIAKLKREIAQIDAARAHARAATERLGHEIEQRFVRAPIEGTLAELAPLRIGGVVAPGARIGTIVPGGDLKVVAYFTPSVALGRIRTGQAAHLRLEGFPWTQYGSPAAHVSSVAGETHEGTVRVELLLDPEQAPVIPLQHGLPARVDVEIERASPASLVLRSVGAYTHVAAATP